MKLQKCWSQSLTALSEQHFCYGQHAIPDCWPLIELNFDPIQETGPKGYCSVLQYLCASYCYRSSFVAVEQQEIPQLLCHSIL